MIDLVPVALAGRSYEVAIGPGLLDQAGERIAPLARRGVTAVVADETVSALHGERLLASLSRAGVRAHVTGIAPGEQAKSFAGLESLCDRLLALDIERGDLIVAFGGGVVGDLAGFAASILKRGVDFVQIPTTLLAQVDSSVGGKTAIDTPRGKNMIGAFHQPRLVIADTDLLATLPRREVICGLAEVLKYGLLGDAAFFDWLSAALPRLLAGDAVALQEAITRSVRMKARIVAEDERESGVRALLNLGHTFGHAVEAETGFSDTLKHGEAVGLGCALAFRFSASQGLCPVEDAHRAGEVLEAAGLPTDLGALHVDALIAHMRSDKKAMDGELTLILARRIGETFVAKGVDEGALKRFLIAEGAES